MQNSEKNGKIQMVLLKNMAFEQCPYSFHTRKVTCMKLDFYAKKLILCASFVIRLNSLWNFYKLNLVEKRLERIYAGQGYLNMILSNAELCKS